MVHRSQLLALVCLSFYFAPSFAIGENVLTVRLLSIGNSFSRNATNHLDDLAKAGGHTLIHRPIVVGGASLELHAEKARKQEADATDADGLYANGRSLKDELTAEAWNFVTVQQASIKSHDPPTYRPYASWLKDYISEHAGGAQLLVHQTWAYRRDDPRFSKPDPAPGEPTTQEEMYRGLTEAYNGITEDLGVRILPVGDAFFAADSDPLWGYRTDMSFNSKTAKYPDLPDQARSLHVGWRWAKAKDAGGYRLEMDGRHANLAGEYLGACVWYEVLFVDSVVGNSYIPEGLDPDYARFLQETAQRAVGAREVPSKRN